jgi:hypothetical protein
MCVWSELLVAVLCSGALPATQPSIQWEVDRSELTVGAPITLILRSTPPEIPHGLRLAIPAHKEVVLSESSWRTVVDDATIILVWFSFDEVEKVAEDPGALQFRPLLDHPGETRITLRAGDTDLGSRVLRITPANAEAREAMELLYPRFVRKAPDVALSICWVEQIANACEGRRAQHPAVLEQLSSTLPTVIKHPDWREIAPAVADHQQLQQERYRLLAASGQRATQPSAGVGFATFETLAGRVRVAQPQSRFARGLRSQTRRLIEEVEVTSHQPAARMPTSQPSPPRPSVAKTVGAVVIPGSQKEGAAE